MIGDACCATPPAGSGSPADLALLFLAGLTISVGHCTGMCGPLVGVVFGARDPERGSLARRLGAYHSGRLLSYAVIGAFFGLVSMFGLRGIGPSGQGALSVACGAAVIALGLELLGVRFVPPIGAVTTRTRPRGLIQVLFRGAMRRGDFPVGVVNGFLPCGPVLAAAIAAGAAAGPIRGAAAMLAYGLGTLPALVVLSVGVRRLPMHRLAHAQRIGAAVVVVTGIQMGLRGLASLGALDHVMLGKVMLW